MEGRAQTMPTTTIQNDDYIDEIRAPPKPPPPLNNPGSDSGSETTATNSSNEFDWFEHDEGTVQKVGTGKRGMWLWNAFMKLARTLRVLLVGIVGAAVFVTPLLVVNLRFGENQVKLQVHVWSLWFSIIWAAGCATYLVVDWIPAIAVGLVKAFGGKSERFKITIELTMAVNAWLKLALDISWAWIALSVIRVVYQPPGSYWTIINRCMQALFSTGLVLLAEKVFLHFVAINFHEKALADRIAENQLGLKALDALSSAQVVPQVKKSTGLPKKGHKSPTTALGRNSPGKLFIKEGVRSVPASPITPSNDNQHNRITNSRKKKKKKGVTSVIVDQVGGAISQVALKHSKFNKESDFSGLYSARRLARKLFSALSDVDPPRSHLIVEDFYPYFNTRTEAHEAFAVFDKDSNGDITKPEMREAVSRIYQERKALISGLKDVDSIVAKLDAVLVTVALVIIIFICLLIFNRSNTLASLVPLATIILGFSFIFVIPHKHYSSLSLIFIFSTHVFDVGDLVMIDDQILFVKEFGLFATTFRRVDGQTVIAPNSLLSTSKLVHNLRRSKSMWESTNLVVSYDTPMETIETLKNKISAYVTANSREWSNFALNIDKMVSQNAIHLIVMIEHRSNWQDWGGRWTRRTAFMRHLKILLESLDIHYTMPIQPVILPPGGVGPNTGGGSIPRMGPPPPGRHTIDSSMLGNAGFYQPDLGSHGGPTFRTGVPTF